MSSLVSAVPDPLQRILKHRHLPTLVVVIGVALFALPVSNSPGMLATAVTIGFYAAIAAPLGLVFGHGGIISVAQASFAALGAYPAAILATQTDVSPWFALAVAILLPTVVAILIAKPILRLPPLALILATLAFGVIVEEAAAGMKSLTNGRVGLSGIPPIEGLTSGRGAYFTIWTAVVLIVAAYVNLVKGSRGRALNATRVDGTMARSVGVDVSWELSKAFALGAGVAGAVGWFYVHYISFIAPESLSFTFSVAVLLMVIIGGERHALGPIIGAVFYVKLQDWLPTGEIQFVIFGLLLAVILIFLPRGLASLPAELAQRFAPRDGRLEVARREPALGSPPPRHRRRGTS